MDADVLATTDGSLAECRILIGCSYVLQMAAHKI
jgi:hypothetical protein